MSLKRNFSYGFLSSAWGALLGLLVVPLYIRYLGTESYGLIGFFATTQVILSLLDLGLSPAINREVARASASGALQEARNLLHTLALVYWAMAGFIVLVFVGLAPVIADHWLQPKHLSRETVTHAIMLMGAVVACRWPASLYMGVLMGLQRLALSSLITAAWATCSSLGAALVLVFFSPTIQAFFLWQAFVGIVYAFAMRFAAWRFMEGQNTPSRFGLENLKRIWRFSAGMTAVSVTGVVLLQLDKILLSRMLSLSDFGRYMLASVMANGLYIMLTPMFNAIYPRMTALAAAGDTQKLVHLYQTGTRLFLAVFFPIAIMAIVYSEDLLFLWTRNQELASSAAILASLLLLGNSLNAVMHFPYALQLAYGLTGISLKIILILIVIFVPLIIVLTSFFGALGGALAWAILNIAYVILGTWLTHKRILTGQGLSWLLQSVGFPFAISAATILAGWHFTYTPGSHSANFIWGGLFLLLAVALNWALLPKEMAAQIRWQKV